MRQIAGQTKYSDAGSTIPRRTTEGAKEVVNIQAKTHIILIIALSLLGFAVMVHGCRITRLEKRVFQQGWEIERP
jgi:hypothetical protein